MLPLSDELRTHNRVAHYPGINVTGRHMVSSDWAAWVQAVGAIGALGLTIILNRADARDRRIERDARARNAGIFIRPPLVEFRNELAEALDQIDKGVSPDHVGPYDRDEPAYGLAGIRTPPIVIFERLPAVAELGSAAKATQAAYKAMENLHAAFAGHYIEEIGECNYDDESQTRATIYMTRVCLGAVDNAIQAIDQLYK